MSEWVRLNKTNSGDMYFTGSYWEVGCHYQGYFVGIPTCSRTTLINFTGLDWKQAEVGMVTLPKINLALVWSFLSTPLNPKKLLQ